MRLALALLAACGSGPVTPAAPIVERDPDEATFGAEQWRVPGTVDYIEFAADETSIIVGTQHGSVLRYGLDGHREAIVEGVVDSVHDFARLDSNTLLLAADRSLVVDTTTHTTHPFSLTGPIERVTIAGNQAVVGAGEERLRVVRLDTGATLVALEHSRGYQHPAISGTWVIAGRRGQGVGVWDLATGKRHRVFALGNDGEVFALTPDHRWIVTGAFGGKPQAIDIYRVEDGKRSATIDVPCSPQLGAISPAGDLLAIACEEEVRIVKVPNGEQVATLKGPGSYLRTAAWSPSGSLFAIGGNDNVLHVWRAATWAALTSVVGSRGEVREISVGDRYLVSHAWGDGSAWLWVTDRVKPVVELGGPRRSILAAALDKDHVLVAVTIDDKLQVTAIERWRNGTRIAKAILPNDGHGLAPLVRAVGAVDGGGAWFTAEGRVWTLDADLRVTWTSPLVGAEDSTVDGHAGATHDGRRVVVHTDGKIIVIDAVQHRVIAQAPFADCGATAPAVSPDGARAALMDGHGIAIINTATGTTITSLAIPSDDQADRGIAWASNDEVIGLAAGKLVEWQLGAKTALVMRAPNAVSVAITGEKIYLGRTDGTVSRRSLGAMRKTATSLAASRAEVCVPYETTGWGWGRLGGGAEPRGRLDDSGEYDEPDPQPPPPESND